MVERASEFIVTPDELRADGFGNQENGNQKIEYSIESHAYSAI